MQRKGDKGERDGVEEGLRFLFLLALVLQTWRVLEVLLCIATPMYDRFIEATLTWHGKAGAIP